MLNRRARTMAMVGLCAGLLLGCSGDDRTTDEGGVGPEEPEVVDGGDPHDDVYRGELADGSTISVRLGVPATDPAVVPFDEFRQVTGAEEPTWLVGEVTPPDGRDSTGRFVTFIEPGGDPLDDDVADRSDGVTNADFACMVIEDWFGAAEVQDQALSDAYMDVYDGPCGGQAHQVLAPAGQTTTYVMVYDGDLPEFETIQAELGNDLARG